MDKFYEYLTKTAASGQLDKKIAVEMLKLLKQEKQTEKRKAGGDIAIIGVALNMPMATSMQEFWDLLVNEVDCVIPFPEGRKQDTDRYVKFVKGPSVNPEYLDCAHLEEIDKFDYKYFRLSPKEASLMDPNQRLFLETAWASLEDAGYGGEALAGSNTGVYVGFNSLGAGLYKNTIEQVEPSSSMIALPGNVTPIIGSRIAYLLDLHGPNMLIDTVCSASLVAMHVAVQALRSGECEIAIAGTVAIAMLPAVYEEGMKMGLESSDDRCRAFDDAADGTSFGEGVISFVLKPMEQALKDNDQIYAVIKGTAVNQDGRKIGITAPNGVAQANCIVKAWQDAGIDPETITFLETHGTGTKLGDPIEADGIQRAFRQFTDKKQFCSIGSVKSNVGHLEAAAGMASVLKAILAMQHKQIPASLFFNRPHRNIEFIDSAFYYTDQLEEWEVEGPRRCGVSSFGLSGTNAHMVFEEAPVRARKPLLPQAGSELLTLSAKNPRVLKVLVRRYLDFLQGGQTAELTLEDLVFTANTGRGHYSHRVALLVRDLDDLRDRLQKLDASEVEAWETLGVVYGTSDEMAMSPELDQLASACVDTLRAEWKQGTMRRETLERLTRLYVAGAKVKWSKLYATSNRARCSLPTYPFERFRCWLDVPDVTATPAVTVQRDDKNLFYEIGWKWQPTHNFAKRAHGGATLVFKGTGALGDSLVERLRTAGREVIEVELGDHFACRSSQSYQLTADKADYVQLLIDLQGVRIGQIVHLFAGKGTDAPTATASYHDGLALGVYSLFDLTQALLQLRPREEIDLVVVVHEAQEVTGREDDVRPEYAALLGLCKVVETECPQLNVRGVDIDERMSVDALLAELETAEQRLVVSFRDGQRYVEVLQELSTEAFADRELTFRQDGAYLITGGVGGLGLEVGRYLAEQGPVRLVLLGHTPFPDRGEWDAIVQAGTDRKLIHKISNIRAMEASGASVSFVCADVCDAEHMAAALDEVRRAHGSLRGIFHLAGIVDDAPLLTKAQVSFERVLDTKAYSAWLLDRLTAEDELDFLVLYSSAATLTGIPGQGDYTAACSYLDALAARRMKRGKQTISIDWTKWKETGMGIHFGQQDVDDPFKALPTKTAIRCLDELLHKQIARVLILDVNYAHEMFAEHVQLPIQLSDSMNAMRRAVWQQQTEQRTPQRTERIRTELEPVQLLGRADGQYTASERLVAAIWGDVLGVKEVDLKENFYDLGGDSLMAMKVFYALEKQGRQVEIVDVLKHLTILEFAGFLDDKGEAGETVAIREVEEKEYYPLSVSQRRLFLLNQIESIGASYNIPFVVIAKGPLDRMRLEQAFSQLIRRHKSLRTGFVYVDGEPMQRVLSDVEFRIQELTMQEGDIEMQVDRFVQTFDLAQAPLLRVGLAELAPERHAILFDMHHIISDGSSVSILVREFLTLYRGESLPPLVRDYADYAEWQAEMLTSEKVQNQKAYWLETFQGPLPVLQIPTDFPRPKTRDFAGNRVQFRLEEQETTRLKQMLAKQGATLYMGLLAAFTVLLAKYSNQDDIIVGTPVAGRPHRDFLETIGMFASTLAMRNRPSGEKTFVQFLQEVKANTLQLFANQEYPFDELIDQLNLPRNLSRNPLFDAMFTMQNFGLPVLELDSLTLKPYEFKRKIAKFDLLLETNEEAGGGLFCDFEYSTALFRAETVERFVTDFLKIVRTVIADEMIRLSDIQLSDAFVKRASALEADVEFHF